MRSNTTVLLVGARRRGRDLMGSWLEASGFDVMACPGPVGPGYVCVGERTGRCPLAEAADVVVLDGRLESGEVPDGTSPYDLLALYRSLDRPCSCWTVTTRSRAWWRRRALCSSTAGAAAGAWSARWKASSARLVAVSSGSAWESALQQLDDAARIIDLDPGVHEVLRNPRRTLEVVGPDPHGRRLDPRVHGLPRAPQHLARPLQGRHPLPPGGDPRRGEGARDVDDVEVRGREHPVRRREGRRDRRPASRCRAASSSG